MDRYTQETLHWLDLRFMPEVHAHFGRDYQPYQPLHGVEDGDWNPSRFLMAARLVRLLAALGALRPESFLDVGGAEGMVVRMVTERLRIPGVSIDLSHQAAIRAVEYSGVPAAAADSARLPFRDGAFDVVFLSEVLEHLANPLRSLLECRRVARRAVVVTTEAFAPTEAERDEELESRRLSPHMDRSIFCPGDFDLVFAGMHLSRTNQCSLLPDPLPQRAEAVAEALRALTREDALEWPAHGIVVVASKEGAPPDPSPHLESAVEAVARAFAPGRCVPDHDRGAAVPAALLERLRCPVTGCEDPRQDGEEIVFRTGRRYPVASGAPRLLDEPGEAFAGTVAEVLEETFGAGAPQVAPLLDLERRLRFDLPDPFTGDRLGFAVEEGWEAEEGGRLTAEEGGARFEVESGEAGLLSPRLRVPAGALRSLRLEVGEGAEGDLEALRVVWWTLERPLFWDGASATPTRFENGVLVWEFPEGLPAGSAEDELLRLRILPASSPFRAGFRGLEILRA